jgi:hypothetical protein
LAKDFSANCDSFDQVNSSDVGAQKILGELGLGADERAAAGDAR